MQIDPLLAKALVELVAVFLMLFGLLAIIWHRVKQDRGITSIAVQFLSISFVFPTILILSLEGILKGETAGTLIGALAGYLFSEFGKSRSRPVLSEDKDKDVLKPDVS